MKIKADEELTEVELLYLFSQSGSSIAVAEDELGLLKDPIFLPRRDISFSRTGRFEAGKEIIKVTMPEWLAIDRGLA